MRRHHVARLLGWTAVAAALAFAGCCKSKEKSGTGTEHTATPSSSEMQAFLADPSKPLTAELYEQFLLALKDCEIKQADIDSKCEAYQNFNKARNRSNGLREIVTVSGKLGTQYIRHESAPVRLQAASMLSSVFGSSAETQKTVLDAAADEKEPAVLRAMIRVVGSRHKSNPDITALLLKSADHESPIVRKEAMNWFTTSFGEGVPKTFEKVLEKLDKDPDMSVRRYLCSRLYGSSDERALPAFEKYLTSKNTPKELFAGCWEGTIAAWTGAVKPKKPSKKAYELTLKVLNTKPRTQDLPPWTGISTLSFAKTEFEANDKFGQEWYQSVKGWYKKNDLMTALEAVALDSDANWMARTGAVDTLKKLGATKATFERMHKKVAEQKDSQSRHVEQRLKKAIAGER